MITRIRHRGLRRLYERGDRGGLRQAHVEKIERVLARLDVSKQPGDMDLPGFGLHPLKGELAGFWSVRVQANWRVVFRFVDGAATDVDYLDYH